jgi:hypothetical protein
MSIRSNIIQRIFPCRYCVDNTSAISSSAKLLPTHETLSICNTPKTLAKAKLQDVKRKSSKNETTELADGMQDQVASASLTDKLEQLEQSRKNTKSRLERMFIRLYFTVLEIF